MTARKTHAAKLLNSFKARMARFEKSFRGASLSKDEVDRMKNEMRRSLADVERSLELCSVYHKAGK